MVLRLLCVVWRGSWVAVQCAALWCRTVQGTPPVMFKVSAQTGVKRIFQCSQEFNYVKYHTAYQKQRKANDV